MYKFVHDHIRFTPTWGETKGAYMTWMDRSGNGFDQATLLIALLTQAAANGTDGYTITNIRVWGRRDQPERARNSRRGSPFRTMPGSPRRSWRAAGSMRDVSPATGAITSVKSCTYGSRRRSMG